MDRSNSLWLKVVWYCYKVLHLRCLKRSWIHLWRAIEDTKLFPSGFPAIKLEGSSVPKAQTVPKIMQEKAYKTQNLRKGQTHLNLCWDQDCVNWCNTECENTRVKRSALCLNCIFLPYYSNQSRDFGVDSYYWLGIK